jgi:hypothetical protein
MGYSSRSVTENDRRTYPGLKMLREDPTGETVSNMDPVLAMIIP